MDELPHCIVMLQLVYLQGGVFFKRITTSYLIPAVAFPV